MTQYIGAPVIGLVIFLLCHQYVHLVHKVSKYSRGCKPNAAQFLVYEIVKTVGKSGNVTCKGPVVQEVGPS